MKFKSWDGKALKGTWTISYKIDGMRVEVKNNVPCSRASNVFHNLENLILQNEGIYEYFAGDWSTSVSYGKSKRQAEHVRQEHLYRLDVLDQRLMVGMYIDPSATLIKALAEKAWAAGYEGLVLHQNDTDIYYRVKEKITYDVRVQELIEGTKASNVGMLGAVRTIYGNVSAGFSKKQRQEFWNDPDFLYSIIEVEAQGFTPGVKFRHPRFIRRRTDKNTESLQ